MQPQPDNPPRPLTDLETSWLARHRIALARLYECALTMPDEEVGEGEQTNEAPVKADYLTAGATEVRDDSTAAGHP
jgi:hypothetical protein